MARGPSVLIIDEDPAVRLLLRRTLATAGYRVADIVPGPGGLERLAGDLFDLLILDIDLPESCNGGAIRAVRAVSAVPILALSIRDDEHSTVDALESGADDYIRKPFNINELLARVKNALRRRARQRNKSALLVTGDLEIDLLYHRVRSRGRNVHLSLKPYEVLRVLAKGAGKAITHEEIIHAVWGARRGNRLQYLRLAIRELRRKLEVDPAHPRHILTETRVGYRLEVQGRPERPSLSRDLRQPNRVHDG